MRIDKCEFVQASSTMCNFSTCFLFCEIVLDSVRSIDISCWIVAWIGTVVLNTIGGQSLSKVCLLVNAMADSWSTDNEHVP